MSNIYIQEPPSKGKILLITSVGDIDIELWSKEAPKACRNFVQLCMEGYYDGLIFHRVVKNFIVQGGDPTGTGTGGESIYGAPFKDEFHSRLRFVRRGLVAMANTGQHDNGSQFFFTMDMTPELQNKHTIFGKVVGPTLYNMLKLQEVETDENERPLYPHKIIRAEILFNPFEDIVPRMIKKAKKEKEDDKKNKSKSKATKNFSLLSFGEEAEEDEEQTFKASKKFNGKSKSSHDLIDDPNLSSVPVVDLADDDNSPVKRKAQEETNAEAEAMLVEDVKQKLKKEIKPEVPKIKNEEPAMEKAKKTKSEEIRSETRKLKRELKAAKKKDEAAKKQVPVEEGEEGKKSPAKEEKEEERPDFLETFKQERQKYKNLKKMQSDKGEIREAQTLALLSKFQSSLASAKQLPTRHSDSEGDEAKDEETADDASDLSWMNHVLQFDEDRKRKVLDANINELDRFDVFDPRNPLTQRRREASAKKAKQK